MTPSSSQGSSTPQGLGSEAGSNSVQAEHFEGLLPGASVDVLPNLEVDRRLARIEMAGEEMAVGWTQRPHRPLAPEVRYLHISRTIHELITDRNRSVGTFLFVASVLIGASSALLNVPAEVNQYVPLVPIQTWCLPVTFAALGLIGGFNSLILIRARVGLLYEVAKMNALLGLPAPRVSRVSPLSIFYLMHLLVVVLGGASLGLALIMTLADQLAGPVGLAIGITLGVIYVGLFQGIYTTVVSQAAHRAADSAKAPANSS